MPASRQQTGKLGGLTKWSRTPDRTAATEPARAAGPGAIDYWIKRLDAELFAGATDQQKFDAADCLRRAHFARLALASAKARRRGGDAA